MLLCLLSIVFGVIIDQVTKYYAVTVLSHMITFPIIKDVFHLTYATNTGGAFSIFDTHPELLTIFSAVMLVAIIIALLLIPKEKKYTILNIGIAMVTSGAIGNLIDRIRLSYVIDFFDFRLISFAIFNVADIFVTMGCAVIVIAILLNKVPEGKDQLNHPFKKEKH